MTEPHFDPSLDLSPGEYQVEVAAVVSDAHAAHTLPPPQTIVLFRLTTPDPDDKKNPQRDLGGRICRAWFDLHSENPATKAARITLAAGGDPILEFGLRRAQGIDGAITASRAAYVGGMPFTDYPNYVGLHVNLTGCYAALGREADARAAGAEGKLDKLLDAVGTDDLQEAIGRVLWVRLARVVMRSDPSRYKTAAVEFLPLIPDPRGFIKV